MLFVLIPLSKQSLQVVEQFVQVYKLKVENTDYKMVKISQQLYNACARLTKKLMDFNMKRILSD